MVKKMKTDEDRLLFVSIIEFIYIISIFDFVNCVGELGLVPGSAICD